MANSSNGMEGDSTTVAAIFTGKTSNNSNIQFYYNANVIGSSKLIVEIKRLSALTTVNVLKRKFLNMAAHGWVIGCIDLPANESISVNFIGIRGSSDIMLDDISYNESPCVGKFNFYSLNLTLNSTNPPPTVRKMFGIPYIKINFSS